MISSTLVAALLFGGPPPPRRIVLAAGQPNGMYDRFGREYRDQLRELGVDVRLLTTNGSLENLERLRQTQADVAFVQSGTYQLVPEASGHVRGIAALYLEPLWVFYRNGSASSLGAFAGRRIGVGPHASGTEAVARALLRAHGIETSAEVFNLTAAEQRDRLEDGRLDVAFFVTSYRDPVIVDLLHRRDVQLLAFPHPAGYVHRVPGLTTVTLPEGVLDLQNHIPPRDTTLLAPAALLLCRAALHPRAVELLLTVAHRIHAPGSLIDEPRRFPSLQALDVPVHEAANVYLTHGESFLSRTLPYGLLRWAVPLRVLIISVIVWIPLLRVLPEISKWRAERRLGHLYAALRQTESAIAAAATPQEIDDHLRGLAALAASTDALAAKMSGGRHQNLYHWRLHVALVREEAHARRLLLEAHPLDFEHRRGRR